MGKTKPKKAGAKLRAASVPAATGAPNSKAARRSRKHDTALSQASIAARTATTRKHRRDQRSQQHIDWHEPAPVHLVARLDVPKVNSKYRSYFEFAENTEKKKKLEFLITNDPNPPAGYEFVPVGHPRLTNECKEISREKEALIFIVSRSKEVDASKISAQIYRSGYHFREQIVTEAKEIVGDAAFASSGPGTIEPIPDTQADINKQADGAIRDLFPRIPNTDREAIIAHAFQKGAVFNGEPVVGLQPELSLSRRVQLAVLAHIRHTHTRYDQLLRETSWQNARKVVEPVCLDFLVKWRGDEETGRDQLDEILREVVIISDSDSDSDDDTDESIVQLATPDSATTNENIDARHNGNTRPPQTRIENTRRMTKHADSATVLSNYRLINGGGRVRDGQRPLPGSPPAIHSPISSRTRKAQQRGFERYRAAWDDAINRQKGGALPPRTDLQSYSMSTHVTKGQEPRACYVEGPREVTYSTSGRPISANDDTSAQRFREPQHRIVYDNRSELHRASLQSFVASGSVHDRGSMLSSPDERHKLQDLLVRSVESTVPASAQRSNAAWRGGDGAGDEHLRGVLHSYQPALECRFHGASSLAKVSDVAHAAPKSDFVVLRSGAAMPHDRMDARRDSYLRPVSPRSHEARYASISTHHQPLSEVLPQTQGRFSGTNPTYDEGEPLRRGHPLQTSAEVPLQQNGWRPDQRQSLHQHDMRFSSHSHVPHSTGTRSMLNPSRVLEVEHPVQARSQAQFISTSERDTRPRMQSDVVIGSGLAHHPDMMISSARRSGLYQPYTAVAPADGFVEYRPRDAGPLYYRAEHSINTAQASHNLSYDQRPSYSSDVAAHSQERQSVVISDQRARAWHGLQHLNSRGRFPGEIIVLD